MRKEVYFTLNGREVKLTGEQVFAPLSDIIRYDQNQTGTKVVCAEGDCGACSVMVARVHLGQKLIYRAVNSCIFTSFLADGCHVITVEGMSRDHDLHEIQDSMVRNFSSQCGFCTPGFVMAMANMFEHKQRPDEKNIKNYLTGNLCRCTGYQSIIDAAKDVDDTKMKKVSELFPLTQESESLRKKTAVSLQVNSGHMTAFAPLTLDEAIEFKVEHPETRIFSGSTDIGVQINKGHHAGDKQMSLHLIEELYELDKQGDEVYVGARVTLDQLQDFLEDDFSEFAEFLNIFASPQIKNSATLIGNLANASPIADTIPVLYAMDALIEIYGPSGLREVDVTKFILGYKKLDMNAGELIKGVRFKLPRENSKISFYKISQRRDLDISCLNAGFHFQVKDDEIMDARIVYGGVGPTTLRLRDVEKTLIGKKVDNQLWRDTYQKIACSINPISDLRGSAEFRTLMAQKLFEKYTEEHFA